MPDYLDGDGLFSEIVTKTVDSAPPELEERLRRAEVFMQLSTLISYEQPIDDLLRELSAFLVEHTRAIAAGLTLVRASNVETLALGYCNLPPGYLEGMQFARQTSEQGAILQERAANSQTYVLRHARTYMLARPEYAHMYSAIDAARFETLIGVPFMVRPETIGSVLLYYRDDVDVDDGEISFARSIGEYARPLMDNAWLYTESQRRAAELEALSRADNSLHQSIFLEDVYQAMIDLAVDLFKADRSMFLALDDQDRLHAFVARGIQESELERLQDVYHGIPGSRWRELPHELHIMEDVQGNARVNPRVREVTTSASSVDIPVSVHGQPFGTFVVSYYQKRTFNDDDRRLFNTLSARAGLAIQNALLFAESQRRANELEALHRADEALSRSLHLDDVLQAMVDLAVELLGGSSSLVAVFEDDDHLGVVATRGIGQETRGMLHERYRRFDRKHFETKPMRAAGVEDVETHPSIDLELRTRMGGPGSLIEIPVVLSSGLFGIFAIGFNRRRTFTDEDRRLFDTFGARASLAIQNALLFEQAQVAASNEERSRLARDLHDSVSQALYGIALGARTARRRLGEDGDRAIVEPVEYIASLAESGLAETRALIFELIPESLANEGLVIALQRQAAAIQARTQVRVSVRVGDEPELPERVKEAFYRIAQESLNNMAKHAQATEAELELSGGAGPVTLTIRDNGRGFDPNGEFPGHFGLQSMEERARRCGASYAIESSPGQGTLVTVVVAATGG